MNTFNKARQKEIAYHEKFYSETELFQPGSWMSRPVKIVMETLEGLDLAQLNVLDLGCGVGRNSIPIAQRVQEFNGKVTCIDLLPSAIDLLSSNADKYGVSKVIESRAVDVEDFQIQKNAYHYIVACSCLEHVNSEEVFIEKLKQMQEGTKENGIHCILLSTEVKEIEANTGEEREGLIELNLSTERTFRYCITCMMVGTSWPKSAPGRRLKSLVAVKKSSSVVTGLRLWRGRIQDQGVEI